MREGNRVCIVYGDREQFSSVAKLRNWSRGLKDLAAVREGRVKVVELEGADHFWAKGETKRDALERVREWLE